MPKAHFHKGDPVTFRLGMRAVQGSIKEDRGPIGINGRRLYLVEFLADPLSPSQIELPVDELLRDAVLELKHRAMVLHDALRGSSIKHFRGILIKQLGPFNQAAKQVLQAISESSLSSRSALADAVEVLKTTLPKLMDIHSKIVGGVDLGASNKEQLRQAYESVRLVGEGLSLIPDEAA